MRKQIEIALIITLMLLIVSIGFLLAKQKSTGQAIQDRYTYTKAICNEDNFCQDYEVTCLNSELTEMTPITGASIQHNPNWEDPRENKSEIICK